LVDPLPELDRDFSKQLIPASFPLPGLASVAKLVAAVTYCRLFVFVFSPRAVPSTTNVHRSLSVYDFFFFSAHPNFPAVSISLFRDDHSYPSTVLTSARSCGAVFPPF